MSGGEEWVRCVDRQGVTEYNGAGIPNVHRWVCRNRRCLEEFDCPREKGRLLHRQVLYGTVDGKEVGEVISVCEPYRGLEEVADLLPGVIRVGPSDPAKGEF